MEELRHGEFTGTFFSDATVLSLALPLRRLFVCKLAVEKGDWPKVVEDDVEYARCLCRWAQAVVCVEVQTQALGGAGVLYDFWIEQLSLERVLCLEELTGYLTERLRGLVEELREAGLRLSALGVEDTLRSPGGMEVLPAFLGSEEVAELKGLWGAWLHKRMRLVPELEGIARTLVDDAQFSSCIYRELQAWSKKDEELIWEKRVFAELGMASASFAPRMVRQGGGSELQAAQEVGE